MGVIETWCGPCKTTLTWLRAHPRPASPRLHMGTSASPAPRTFKEPSMRPASLTKLVALNVLRPGNDLQTGRCAFKDSLGGVRRASLQFLVPTKCRRAPHTYTLQARAPSLIISAVTPNACWDHSFGGGSYTNTCLRGGVRKPGVFFPRISAPQGRTPCSARQVISVWRMARGPVASPL